LADGKGGPRNTRNGIYLIREAAAGIRVSIEIDSTIPGIRALARVTLGFVSRLLDLLRRNEAQTFIRNAEIVREYPDCLARTDAARWQVHHAMYRPALGTDHGTRTRADQY
jgi:hypothetical protein